MRAIVLVPALALAVCCGTPEDSGPRKPAVCEAVGPTTEELASA